MFTLTTLGFSTQETQLEVLITLETQLVPRQTTRMRLMALEMVMVICAHLAVLQVDLLTNLTQHTFLVTLTEVAHMLFTTLELPPTERGHVVLYQRTLLTF
jgi:hypothetical protein